MIEPVAAHLARAASQLSGPGDVVTGVAPSKCGIQDVRLWSVGLQR